MQCNATGFISPEIEKKSHRRSFNGFSDDSGPLSKFNPGTKVKKSPKYDICVPPCFSAISTWMAKMEDINMSGSG